MVCKKCNKENSEEAIFCETCGERLQDVYVSDNKRVCPHCGSENKFEAQYCNKCGGNLIQNSTNTSSGDKINIDMLIWKIVCIVGGIIGTAIGAYIIYSEKNDWFGYTYEPPYTDHEIGVIFFIIASIIVFIVGCCIAISDKTDEDQ